MTLGNMREQGVRHLIAFCLHDACRHQALIDVSSYPGVRCERCRGGDRASRQREKHGCGHRNDHKGDGHRTQVHGRLSFPCRKSPCYIADSRG
jgi:hypothetical protein